MKPTRLIVLTAVALLGAAASPAAAGATFGDYLAYCAGGSTAVDNSVRDSALGACGVQKGNKTACSVISGSPWVCATASSAPRADEQCDYHQLTFEIAVGFKMPGDWSVAEGSAKATYTRYSQRKNITTCTPTPVTPPPTGSGGAYSSESGDMVTSVFFKIEGSIKVKTNLGVLIELNASAGCNRSTSTSFFREATTNSCGPSPSPSATSTASPTGSPTATATPTGTPTYPTATPTQPPPSPPATASPSPTETPTASPSAPSPSATGTP